MASSPRSASDYSFDTNSFIDTRSIGTQTEVNPKEYISARDLSTFDLEGAKFIQRPHMFTCLLIVTALMIYGSLNKVEPTSDSSFVANSRT